LADEQLGDVGDAIGLGLRPAGRVDRLLGFADDLARPLEANLQDPALSIAPHRFGHR
jgi:hypothetical protein